MWPRGSSWAINRLHPAGRIPFGIIYHPPILSRRPWSSESLAQILSYHTLTFCHFSCRRECSLYTSFPVSCSLSRSRIQLQCWNSRSSSPLSPYSLSWSLSLHFRSFRPWTCVVWNLQNPERPPPCLPQPLSLSRLQYHTITALSNAK